METFDLCFFTAEPSASVTHRTLKAKFGDGYEQAAGDGINPKQSDWNLTFDGTRAEIEDVIAFLDAHGEWKRFEWTDPLGNEAVYRAGPYQATAYGGDRITVSVTFMQKGAV